MKTAMQEAIDKVSFIIDLWNNKDNEVYMPDIMELLKVNLNQLLKKEEEQIRNAYILGHYDSSLDIYNPSECYSEIKNQNK